MTWINLKHGELLEPLPTALTVETAEVIDEVAKKILSLGGDKMVAIHFSAFRDGRGFSLAHLLRRQYQFDGQLIAIGALPDQAQMLYRAGFDYADVGTKKPIAWQDAIKTYSVAYQPSIRPLPKKTTA